MNIKLDHLLKKYANWNFDHAKKNQNTVVISGSSANNTEELFELLHEISTTNDHSLHIAIKQDLKLITATVKKSAAQKKYAKMYTSGCFDIFHYGHLNILENSKKMCDHLIVGVSTDELILKEKGKLPVVPFEERIRIVEALKCVDKVIPQVDKNKQKIVDAYNIDAISVGDDWRGRFPKTSCVVEYFSYTKSVSSTILKDKLKITN